MIYVVYNFVVQTTYIYQTNKRGSILYSVCLLPTFLLPFNSKLFNIFNKVRAYSEIMAHTRKRHVFGFFLNCKTNTANDYYRYNHIFLYNQSDISRLMFLLSPSRSKDKLSYLWHNNELYDMLKCRNFEHVQIFVVYGEEMILNVYAQLYKYVCILEQWNKVKRKRKLPQH